MLWHMQGIRRLSDQHRVNRRTLHDGLGTGLSNMLEVNFRPGEHGRLVWTHEGEDYYVQWMPAALQAFEAPADLMIAQMDELGVDVGVIWSTRKQPTKYVGPAQQAQLGSSLVAFPIRPSSSHSCNCFLIGSTIFGLRFTCRN